MNSGPGDLKDEASKNIKRYLGRHAVGFSGTRRMVSKKLNQDTTEPQAVPCNQNVVPVTNKPSQTRMNISFCVDFDEAVLSAMDQLERDYEAEKKRSDNSKAASISDDFTAKRSKQDNITTSAVSSCTNNAIACTSNKLKCNMSSKNYANKAEVLNVAAVNSEPPTNVRKQKILAKTPHSKTNGSYESLQNGSICTWVTPLHVSTPVDALCQNTNCNTELMHLRSDNLQGTMNVNYVNATPKVVGPKSKSNLEKTKLFQAILNLSADDGVADGLLSSNHNSTSAGLVGLKDGIEMQDVHCDQIVNKPGDVLSTDVSIKITSSDQVLKSDASSNDDRLKLSCWGLPLAVLQRYEERGVTSLFAWQAECLCSGKVLAGGNLVYAAPTSAGKTMVTELLMLKCVMETKKKALFILPFVAVAREKVSYLQGLFQDVGVRVDGYFGHVSPAGGLTSVDIAVCTIEKANSLVNRLLEDGKIDQLGMVVVDELHLVGDSHRGYLLELLLTKLRYVAKCMMAQQATKGSNKALINPIQIIGMSATLPNLHVVAYWLDADLYRTDYRPVPLTELVKIGTDIYDQTISNRLRSISPSAAGRSGSDDGDIVPLCLETVSDGCSVLIFCPTKNWCEKLADGIAREFYRLLNEFHAQGTGFIKASELVPLKLNFEMLRDVIEQLKRTPIGLDTLLAKMVPLGVAFHHAGLTFDERDIIEGAFRNGALRVLVATSTLSSGVNLPARRVIVRTPMFHGAVIDTLTYKQMIGRAGRKGIDTYGESILICKPSEKNAARSLASSELPPVRSCLFSSGDSANLSSSMKRAILEIVVSKVAKTPDEVETYAECTLLAATIACEGTSQADGRQPADKSSAVKPYITYLLDSEFITRHSIINPDGSETVILAPTQLGSAVVASALSPDEGLAVFSELQKARRCFVLENELHTVYLVTPLYAQDQWGNIDWMQYLCLWEQLSADMKRVAELVGIQERYLARAVRSGGTAPCQTAAQARTAAIHRRFYAAMALHDLANEVPLSEVVKKYGCTRGVLQSLQQSAATFAGMVTVFCNRLGWYNLELLLAQFQSRLSFGVQRELVDLVRISLLNAQRARTFFNAGYQTIASLASAQPVVVEQIIRNSAPFLSKKKAEDEAEWEVQERCKSRCIWLTGQKGLTEYDAAVLIIQEAKELLASDLFQLGVDWKPAECGPSKSVEKKKRQFPSGKRCQRASLKCSQVNASRRRSRNKDDSENRDPDGSSAHSKTILTPPLSMNYCRRLSLEDQLANGHDKVEKQKQLDLLLVTDPVTINDDLNFKPADKDDVARKEHCTDSNISAGNGAAQSKITCDELKLGRGCANKNEFPFINKLSDLGTDKKDVADVLFAGKICHQTSDASCLRSTVLQEAKVEPVKAASISVTPAELMRNTVAHVLSAQSESAACQTMEKSNSNIFLDSDIVNAISSPMTNIDSEEIRVRLAEAPEVKSDVSIKDVQTGGTSDLHESRNININASIDGEFGSVICQYMKDFCTQGLVDEEILVDRAFKCISENVAPQAADTVAENVINDNSVALTTGLLPASAYDRENNTSVPALGPDAGYSENMLFDDDCDTTGRDLRNNSQNSGRHVNEEVAAMLCSSSIHEEEMINGDNIYDNHSDLFTSFMEDHLPEQTTNVVKSAANVKSTETQENMNDDSWVGTLLEKALALAPSTNDDYLRGDDAVNNFSKAQSESHSINYIPVASDSDGKQVVKSGIGSNIESVPDGETPGHCSPKRWPCDGSDFTASALIDAFLQSHSPVKQSQETRACILDKLPEITSKRKADDKHEKRKRQRKENEDRNSANSSKCQNVSLNCASASDSSSYIPPTPPSTNKNALASNTPRRLVGGVSGTTPRKGNVSSVNIRQNVGNNSMTSGCLGVAGECRSATEANKENCEGTKVATYGATTQSVSQLPLSGQSFTVIDVAASRQLFDNFIAEWRSRETFSLSLACEKVLPSQTKSAKANGGIGAKFSRGSRKSVASSPSLTQQADGIPVESTDVVLVGLAVSWECYDAYYISLTASTIPGDLDGSMTAPPLDESLSVADRLTAIRSVLNGAVGRTNHTQCVTVFDVREQYKLLSQCCGVAFAVKCMDPKVACWLLDPASNEKNLHSMVTNYCPQEVHLLQGVSCGTGLGSIGITPVTTSSGRMRACLESVLVNSVMACLQRRLIEVGLHESFVNVEMPSLLILTKMELNGMGFNLAASEDQKSTIQVKLSALEDRAYQLAGHPFSLTSVDDVGQVLFVELRLPSTGDVKSSRSKPETRKTAAAARRAKPTWSTAKDVLEKLKTVHPLPGILLEWRRLTAALTKVVFPLQKARISCDRLSMDRIHSAVDTFTATGRVTMHEPNLQNIPKDFNIDIEVTAPIATPRQKRVSRSRHSSTSSLMSPSVRPPTNSYSVSMRNSFVPFSGGVLLAADYSQLELRVIAHLSGDRKLLRVLNGGGDVFRIIASQWKMISVDDVTDIQRQQAKQVCYGMIYGIGPQALGEQLGVDENEAAVFIESFKATFSGLRSFLRDTVQSCRRDGFVKTILGRRRYLPAINSTNHHAKAHAERQAVNTTVQGSGADLVKTAMINIDDELARRFPDTIISHRHRQLDVVSSRGSAKQKRLAAAPPRGAYFILQLHDELIYEVNTLDMREVCRIVKQSMESAMKLSVKLPVKLKAGPSWGSMVDVEINKRPLLTKQSVR